MIEKAVGKMNKINENSRLDGAIYYSKVSDIMAKIHAEIPYQKLNARQVATSTEIREEFFNGKNVKRAVMYLMSNGCEWALKKGNGCTMCGHISKQMLRDNKLKTEDFIKQFDDEFNKVDFSDKPVLNIFNNGSFLNDEEISKEAQEYILQRINENPYIKKVVLESRPEFVNEEKIKRTSELVKDKVLEVAIGLEMKDDTYRNISINKGFTLNQYDAAAKILTKYAGLRTYVLLKPPFLNESESIKVAIETIEHAFSVGASTVSLEACTVQDYTLVKYLHERNKYKSPWLWSIIEVVKNTHHLGNVVVGLFKFYPSPTNVPYNCDQCSDDVLAALKEYNNTRNISVLYNLDCSCKTTWEKDLEENRKDYFDELGENLV